MRLFTTLIRYDVVYATHFRCGRLRLVDLPNTAAYVREIYQMPGLYVYTSIFLICSMYVFMRSTRCRVRTGRIGY